MTAKQIRWIRNACLIGTGLIVFLLVAVYVLAQVYKKEILAEVNKSINEELSGELVIGDIHFTLFSHFPSLSLTLEDAVLRDSLHSVHKQELFHAEKIYLQLEILKLLSGKIDLHDVTIQNASIHIVRMKNGYQNSSILKKDQQEKKTDEKNSSLGTTVNKILMKNVIFIIVDSTKNKWFSFRFQDTDYELDIRDSIIAGRLSGSVYFGGLAFKAEKGSFLTNKNAFVDLILEFNLNKKDLLISPSKVTIDGRAFFLKGNFQFRDTSHMHLEIDAPAITTAEANAIVTQHIADKLDLFQFENPLMAAIFIDGDLYYGSKPSVDVFFKTEKNSLTMKTKSFYNVSLLGWFRNHIDSTRINDDENSRVMIPRFTGNLEGIPLSSKLMITNLSDPDLLMDASVDMALTDAGSLVDSTLMNFGQGTLQLNFNYDGKLIDYIDTVNKNLRANLKGGLKIYDGEVYYLPRGLDFEKVNASMTFNDTVLEINQLAFELNKNPVNVSGKIHRFINYIFIPGDYLFAELLVNASSLNLDNLKSAAPAVKKTSKTTTASKLARKKNFTNTVKSILSTIEADILLSADNVSSRRFTASNVKGHVILTDEYLKCRDITMATSGGTFKLNGEVTNLIKAPYRMNINAVITNADLSNLFYSFDDFDQETITHKNLKGRLSTNVSFSAQLKKDYSVMGTTMGGQVDFQIKDGALIDFQPLEKVTKFAFKNRGLDDIEFAKLSNTMTITGQDLHFSRMEIASTAFTLFVEGTYSFVPGKTDMSIQIPLSNLKKRDLNIMPIKVGTDSKTGPSIYLRAYDDTDGELQLKYDPFKGYYKENITAPDSVTTKKEKKKSKT